MTRYVEQTSLFKRQVKLAVKRGKDIEKLQQIVRQLIKDSPLAVKYRDHKLTGNFCGCRECHIEPDWLLIYRLTADGGLELVETGTHADLFS
ncbi:mRNA interferase YafQ [hydrothermal vent metagenome]|uniref:mRNA interferase YafQ n=1 Tax=hydrothermal vent metagenome TaxID=652676 RepID=A0A3B1BTM0_9ZZZZ